MSGHGPDLVQTFWIGLAHLSFRVSGSQLVLLKCAWVCSSSVGSQLCPVHSVCTEAGEEKYVYRAQCVLLNSEQDERSLGRGTGFLWRWVRRGFLVFDIVSTIYCFPLSLLPETWVITNSPRLTPVVLRTWRIFRKCKCSPKPTGMEGRKVWGGGGRIFSYYTVPTLLGEWSQLIGRHFAYRSSLTNGTRTISFIHGFSYPQSTKNAK